MDHLDEEGAGPAPVTDHGIQLGWDDEDILIGQNRQLGLDPDGTTPADAPRGVGGYRVDVRHPGAAAWTSLSTVHRDHVMLGTYNAGTFDGELRTEVHPRTIYGKMWLPAYFTSWTGGSMVVDTYADKVLRGVPNPTRALYDPVSPYAVQLRYGQRYEFRVRMTDASGGGPAVTDSPYREGESPVGGTPFLRYLPPKKLLVTDQQTSANGISLSVARPLIDYPAAIYAGIPNAVDELLAIHDANVAAYAADPTAVPKEVGLPDPDVAYVEIRVMVRPPAFDREGVEDGWREVYMTRRTFPTDPAASLTLIADYVDVAHLGDLDLSGQAGANATGPVVVPTARDVRLELRALTRDDPTYFGTERARRSKRISIDLHGTASAENGLFRQLDLPRTLASVFLRNDPLADGAAQTGIHPQNDPAPVLLARLANAVGLVITDEDTLSGPQGQRVVFGCTGLKHRLSPESATLTLTHIPELANVWVNVFRAEINRDWSWKGTDSPAATLRRQLQLQPTGIPTTEDLGTVELPHSVNAIATSGDIDRERIVLIYLDAFSAPVDNGRPYEIAIQYDLSVRLEDSQHVTTSAQTLLPVTTPPKQMPQVVSAGHALSEYVADEAYSATAPRARSLWLEMAAPLADRRDAYFVRVLAHSPDPMLLARAEPAADPVGEAKSPLDPELVRVIVPGQSDDFAGLATMQKLIPAAGSDRHFLVPLPPDTTVGSPELFGFYSYEVRVGHDAGNATEPFWSTAQGRFGPRLTIEGVQHPAPGLTCVATRLNGAVLAAAPYAQPFYQSANVLPDPPNTEIWMALYVQVHQADRASMRNILVDLRQARVPDKRQPVPARPRERFAEARWDDASLAALVGQLGLDHDAPLSVLAIEILPEPNGGFRDPLGGDLGDVRVLRTSPLAPIATVCC